MIEIDTGSKTVLRFDNLIDHNTCDMIYNFAINFGRNVVNGGKGDLPWNNGDTFSWFNIPDINLQKSILEHRNIIEQLILSKLNLQVYTEFTDIVLWKQGRSMLRHRDNGYVDTDVLRNRVVSSVTYLNDDFEGGETFIKTENGSDFISVPKKGSTVIFFSDERNEHGVNLVRSGNRVTLPLWFCTDRKHSEDLKNADRILKILQ